MLKRFFDVCALYQPTWWAGIPAQKELVGWFMHIDTAIYKRQDPTGPKAALEAAPPSLKR